MRLGLGVVQIGGDFALPYGNPILSQGPEVLFRAWPWPIRTAGGIIPRAGSVPTIIHAAFIAQPRGQVLPGWCDETYDGHALTAIAVP